MAQGVLDPQCALLLIDIRLKPQQIDLEFMKYLNEFKKHINLDNQSTLFIDKLPLNIINTGEILRIFPNAKFILSLRHPMDCVLSCFIAELL